MGQIGSGPVGSFPMVGSGNDGKSLVFDELGQVLDFHFLFILN